TIVRKRVAATVVAGHLTPHHAAVPGATPSPRPYGVSADMPNVEAATVVAGHLTPHHAAVPGATPRPYGVSADMLNVEAATVVAGAALGPLGVSADVKNVEDATATGVTGHLNQHHGAALRLHAETADANIGAAETVVAGPLSSKKRRRNKKPAKDGTKRGRPVGVKMQQPTKQQLREAAAAAGAAAAAVASSSTIMRSLVLFQEKPRRSRRLKSLQGDLTPGQQPEGSKDQKYYPYWQDDPFFRNPDFIEDVREEEDEDASVSQCAAEGEPLSNLVEEEPPVNLVEEEPHENVVEEEPPPFLLEQEPPLPLDFDEDVLRTPEDDFSRYVAKEETDVPYAPVPADVFEGLQYPTKSCKACHVEECKYLINPCNHIGVCDQCKEQYQFQIVRCFGCGVIHLLTFEKFFD
ncbi:Nuclear factor of activated T-cells, cytoplasmic 3, partial [Frankliniella fusca]